MSFGKILQSDFIPNVLSKAAPILDEDRARYKPIWETTLGYCKTHNLIISDRLALFKIKKTREQYNIYCMNPFKHAINLANLIHQTCGERMIFVQTVKEHEELCIFIDTRALINIYAIEKYRKLDVLKLINPVEINGNFYMPPEIEIIEVYNDLYNPAKFSDWESLQENDARNLLEKIMDRKKIGILGSNECRSKRREFIDIMKLDILQKWMPKQKEIILIGAWAYNLLGKGLRSICSDSEKIQIISALDPLDVINTIRAELQINYEIIAKEQELHIPKDFRTKRYTFYLVIDTVEKPFLDLFNSSSFELIPYYTRDGIMVADHAVILRFLFIDLWIVRLIEKLGIINKDVYHNKLNYIIKIISHFSTAKEVPRIKYLGIFHDYGIDKKIFNIARNIFHKKYMPEHHLKEKGAYWVI